MLALRFAVGNLGFVSAFLTTKSRTPATFFHTLEGGEGGRVVLLWLNFAYSAVLIGRCTQ